MCNDAGELERLLNFRKDDIYELYEKCWLNTEYLEPTGRNQFQALKYLMREQAERLVEENLLSRRDAEYILKKLESLYGEIGDSL